MNKSQMFFRESFERQLPGPSEHILLVHRQLSPSWYYSPLSASQNAL